MNKSELKQAFLAMMYGDAYLDVNINSGKARFDIYHNAKNEDYLIWKSEIISIIADNNIKDKIDKRKLVNGNVRVGKRLQSSFSRYFYNLSVTPEKFKIKQLVKPLALSILWQDDGTISWHGKNFSTAVLCTDSWREDFIINFREEFNKYYGWCPTIMHASCRGSKYTRLRFKKKEMEKLSDIIKSYIVPSMKYKIIS